MNTPLPLLPSSVPAPAVIRGVRAPASRRGAVRSPLLRGMGVLAGMLALALALPAAAAEVRLRGLLNGRNVVPAVDTPAQGEMRARLDDDGALRIYLIYSDLNEYATGASVHLAPPGQNGPQIGELVIETAAPPDTDIGRIVGEELRTDAATAARIRAGEAYLLVRTREHPAGALRAQLVPRPPRAKPAPPAERPVTSPVPAPAVPPAPVRTPTRPPR